MNKLTLSRSLGFLSDEIIYEADEKRTREKSGRRIKYIAAAACLCIILAGGIMLKNAEEKIIPVGNIREISDNFGGRLLAQNLDLSEDDSPTILLSCTGGLGDPSGWEMLSVSADYPDCTVVLNCSFDKKSSGDISEASDFLEYGDVLVKIFLEEPTPEYKYVSRAVFECDGVYYELNAKSNSAERIYGLLDMLMGKDIGDLGEFSEVLGFSGCKVRVSETAPHFFTWHFYTETDGVKRCLAEMIGRFDSKLPEAYSADLDGDGTDELICNCVSGDGSQTVTVYRNNGGKTEAGYVKEAFYDGLGAVSFGPGSFTERYDPEQGFVITYYTETADGSERKTAAFKSGLDNFDFYLFEPSD